MINFIIPWFGPAIPQRNLDCIAISRTTIEAAGHSLEVRTMQAIEDPRQAAIEKDIWALTMAQTEPDFGTLDADLELTSMWDMPEDLPYFAQFCGNPHIGMFAVNGCCDRFVELWAEKELRQIQNVYGFPNKILRDKKWGKIPDSCYTHHRFTGGK